MRALELSSLGDEPIYCATQDDEVLYSGSDDDYYEHPEDRRIRIEAKAVQYLNGNDPYILSAGLRGPFDAASWNNPWRSKRTQRRPAAQRGPPSRPSISTVEVARGYSSNDANNDLADTQRTSLFPLPSPEITNPPSARKNPYMHEDEYSRIKSWRETVKKVPLPTDPFWASYKDGSERSTSPRKRYGDQDWLHKRESKKRKPEDLRKLPQDESPSQAAAKSRESQGSGRSTDIVTQSAPGFSTHEGELSANWGHHNASFDTSRMVNIPTNTPGILRTAKKSQCFTRPISGRSLPSLSEDDISPLAVEKSSVQKGKKTALSNPLTQSSDDQANKTQPAVESHISPSQHSRKPLERNELSVRRERAITDQSLHVAPGRIDDVVDEADPAGIFMTYGPVENDERILAKKSAKKAVGVSQRDDSFYFHQARPRHRSPPTSSLPVLPVGQEDETTLSLPPSQQTPPVAVETTTAEGHEAHKHTESDCAPTTQNDQMDLIFSENQAPPFEALIEVEIVDDDAKVIDAVSLPNAQVPVNHQDIENLANMGKRPQQVAVDSGQPQCTGLMINTSSEPNRSKSACTQELSPVSIQDKPQGSVASAKIPEDPPSTACPEAHHADVSNLEWSTYVNTQDISTGSQHPSAILRAATDAEISSQDDADPEDPEWTTYVNTQDTTVPASESGTALENADGIKIVEQGPDDAPDPEWSTVLNTPQDLSTIQTQDEETYTANNEEAVEEQQHDAKASGMEDIESESDLSSYESVSSRGIADCTGNTSNEPVAADGPAVNSRESQDTLGGIIDGYASSDQSFEEFEDCPESQDSTTQQDKNLAATQHREGDDLLGNGGQLEQDVTSLTESFQDGQGPLTPILPDRSSMGAADQSVNDFDGTTASLESHDLPTERPAVQSPWTEGAIDVGMPITVDANATVDESTSRLSLLAGQALACSPAPQTPWIGDRLPSPSFSLSVKRFSDFMRLSPLKKHVCADSSILRSSNTTSRVLFGSPLPAKPKRRVTFAPLPGEDTSGCELEVKNEESLVEEDLSYFDAKGKKTATFRITRSQTRAASPPPLDVGNADAKDLPDHDNKFARHFEVMSKRKKDPPRKVQRLLPSESQQTDGSQAIDAMAEAFIQASQTRQQSFDLHEVVSDNSRLSQLSPEKIVSPMAMDPAEERENIEPVDDVSAVLDNIDDFLDNSWGFNTSTDIDMEKETPTKQKTEVVPSRFANVGDPMLTLHANVWAD